MSKTSLGLKEKTHQHHTNPDASEKSIFVAFLLNLLFSVVEFVGGCLTGSISILADAIHDIGDAASIGIALAFEKKSKRAPNIRYTFGYGRYSLMGAVITNTILIFSGILLIYHSVGRIFEPKHVHSTWMMIIAVVGLVVNGVAMFVTRGKKNQNQKAVNLHMLEDVLGWAIVLLGSVLIKLTGWNFIDPLFSLLLAVFILYSAIRGIVITIPIFMEKVPDDIDIFHIREEITELECVDAVEKLHIWSVDGRHPYAIVHVKLKENSKDIKKIEEILSEHKIEYITIQAS